MIAGQALLDLFLAATRWQHRMRYEVVSRSFVEPYAAMAIAAAAWFAGFDETGLLISYWAGTLLALAYAIWGTPPELRLARASQLAPRPGPDKVDPPRRRGADGQRPCFRPLHPARPLSGRPVPRREPGRHLRRGAPGQDADPPGPTELRRAADPDRRQDARRQRSAADRNRFGLGGEADPRHPARHPGRARGRSACRCSTGSVRNSRSATWRCFCSRSRRRSRARSASPT